MKQTVGTAVASMILGIVGLFFFGIILGILALILGGVAMNKINSDPEKFSGKGMAITGIVLGIVDVVAFIACMSAISQ